MINRGDKRAFIVAEMSANHNGSIDIAEAIIRKAADVGANAVKLQTYTAETLTMHCDNNYFKIRGTSWDGSTLYDLYNKAYMPWEWTPRLIKLANDLGIECFSTPFDCSAVDFLESCGVKYYKIASFEIVDIPLLKRVAQTHKPIIMSTGLASLSEIDEAVKTLRTNGAHNITLLKCTSAYPAPIEEANLLTLKHLSTTFSCEVGVSDHTLGSTVPVVAVALGATFIEKHMTLSRKNHGPDDSFSMEPNEFKLMIQSVREAERAIGKVCYEITESQRNSEIFRRSIFVTKSVKKGEMFNKDNIRCIRPAYGLHPRYYESVIGSTATQDIAEGTPLLLAHCKFKI